MLYFRDMLIRKALEATGAAARSALPPRDDKAGIALPDAGSVALTWQPLAPRVNIFIFTLNDLDKHC